MTRRRQRRPAGAAALRRVGIVAGLIAGAGGVHGVLAQGLSGSTLTATISQRFEADSNYRLEPSSPGTSYFGDTRLALALISETPTQVFRLGFDTGIRALWEAGEDFDLTFASPSTANVSYGQEWADAAFDTFFAYRQTAIDYDWLDVELDEETGLPDNLNQLSGNTTERRYDAGVTLALGTDSRSTYTFSLNATRIDYSDDDSGQSPRTNATGAVTWSLQLTPILQSQLAGSYYYYEAEDSEDTEIRIGEFDAWLNYTPSDNLVVGAALGYADRQREETIDGSRVRTEDEQGITARARIDYAFEDFTLTGNARVTTAAPETRLSGDLRAVYPLPRGSVNARIFQHYTGGGSESSDEVRVTSAGFGFTRELTTLASIGLDFSAAHQENLDDPGDPDINRYDARVTFSYDLTEALSADVGYRFRYRDDGPDDADSHAVFFSIGRTFVTQR